MYNANNMVKFGASNGPSYVQGSENAYKLNVLEASSQINPPEKDQVRDTVFLQWQSPQLSSSSWAFIPLFLSCQSPSSSEVQDPVEGINQSYLHLIPHGTEGGGILDPKVRVRRGWKKASYCLDFKLDIWKPVRISVLKRWIYYQHISYFSY